MTVWSSRKLVEKLRSTYMSIGDGSLNKRPRGGADIASHDIWEVGNGDWNLESSVGVILRIFRVADALIQFVILSSRVSSLFAEELPYHPLLLDDGLERMFKASQQLKKKSISKVYGHINVLVVI